MRLEQVGQAALAGEREHLLQGGRWRLEGRLGRGGELRPVRRRLRWVGKRGRLRGCTRREGSVRIVADREGERV